MIRKHVAWILLGLSVALNLTFIGGFVHARMTAQPGFPAEFRPVVGTLDPGNTTLPQPPAQTPPGPGGRRQGLAGPEVVRELNLDDGQTRALRQMVGETRRRSADKVREMAIQRDALVAELRKEKPDQRAMDMAIDRIASLRADVQKESMQAGLRFADTLRPDQRERYRQIILSRTLNLPGTPGSAGPVGRPGEGRR